MATFTFLGANYECPKSKNESIHDWYDRVEPNDFQTVLIPHKATFANSRTLLSKHYEIGQSGISPLIRWLGI